LHDTGERLGQRGVAKARPRFEPDQMFLHQSRRHHDGFGIGPVEKQEIVTEIFLAPLTEEAIAARRRIRDYDAITDAPIPISEFGLWTSNLADDTCEFVAKDCRRHDHPRVIAAFEHLQVRAARQRRLNIDANFTGFKRAGRDLLNFDLFLAV